MTEDEVKKILNDLRELTTEIIGLKDTKRMLEENMGAIRAVDYERPRVTCSSNSDIARSLERLYEQLEKILKDLAEAAERLDDIYQKGIKLIELCQSSKSRTILRDYYIKCKTLDQIALELGYEESWPKKLKRRAIKEIAQAASHKSPF